MPPYSDELMAWCRTNLERARGLESQLVGHVVAHLTDPMSNPSPLAFSAEFPEEAHYIYELATCYGFNILPSSTETSAVYILGPTPEAMPKCSLVRAAHGGKRPAPVQSSEKFAHSMLRIDRKKASPSEAAPPVLVPRDSAGDYVVALPPRRRVHTTQFSMLGAEDDEESEARSAMSVVANLNNDDVCCVCLDPLLSLSRAKSGESLALLRCCHVLHEPCSKAVLGAQGTSANVRSGTPCPICRADSPYVTKVSLEVRSARGTLVAPTPPIPPPVATKPASSSSSKSRSGAGAIAQAKGKKKNAVFDDDPMLFELQAMGFDLETARNALEASEGYLPRAVEFLLSQ